MAFGKEDSRVADVMRQVTMINKEKFRSPSEVMARYNQGLEKYHQLQANPNTDRAHLQTLYSELKALGWVMGRDEQKVIKEIMTPPKPDPNQKPVKMRRY